MEVYLDNSATTKVAPEVIDAMTMVMRDFYGNPSSMHQKGLESERLMNKCRKDILKSLGLENSHDLIFVSGGTEADNLASLGTSRRNKKRRPKLITSSIEHPAVLEAFRQLEKEGFEVAYIPVGEDGIIDVKTLETNIDEKTALVSIMRGNNEVGSLQPIGKIRELAKKQGVIFHTDAVQSFGKVNDNIADLVSISGHKIYGPKGIGALAIKKGLNINPINFGGGQEKGIRSGTENLPAIAGFAKAAAMVDAEKFNDRVGALKKRLYDGLKSQIKDIIFNGESSLPNILNVSFIGTRSEVILHSLESKGVYVSSGSACSSKDTKGSHVLKAMRKNDKDVESAIRFSLGIYNTEEEIDYAIEVVKDAVENFRRLGSFR